MSSAKHYDAVVTGGGHNGLAAATYLARAGLSVLVLERLGHVGGAAVSAQAFPGHDATVSRYAHSASLLPEQLVHDLQLDVALVTHANSSYTPTLREGRPGGLLVERPEGPATAASFEALTGGPTEYDAWREFHADVADLTHAVAPTLLRPLPTEGAVRAQVDPGAWRDLVSRPLGVTIEERFADDTVRGLLASDALLGTFASLHDPSLLPNKCFLHQRLGTATGGWRVPVGGMGAVTSALERAARAAGVEIATGAGVSAVRGSDEQAEVDFHDGRDSHTVDARFVLANVAPWVLRILLGEDEDPTTKPEGSQVTINLLVDRLPRLRSGVDPAVAFSGRLLLAGQYSRLGAAYADAAAGRMPSVLPGEVRCHSLTDPSVLGSAADGTHTLSYLSLLTPASLFEGDPTAAAHQAVTQAFASLDEHLVEPIETCLARDSSGRPCLEVQTPHDVEAELAMPGGHMWHGDLEWPWAANRARLETPAQQWGVQTDLPSVLVCGAGARRGGGISGIGGHNAAQAVLATL